MQILPERVQFLISEMKWQKLFLSLLFHDLTPLHSEWQKVLSAIGLNYANSEPPPV